MINVRRLSSWMGILILLIFLSGCAERPFLTKDNSYSILKVSPAGETQKYPIQLSWNSNVAVMQKLLLEASFVLSDLHTQLNTDKVSQKDELNKAIQPTNETLNQEVKDAPPKPELSKVIEGEISEVSSEKMATPKTDTILLEVNFPQAKKFNLVIDDKQSTLDVSSIQIEVEGGNPGKVIINQTMVLQGIPNTSLQTSYEEFTKMLNNQKKLAN